MLRVFSLVCERCNIYTYIAASIQGVRLNLQSQQCQGPPHADAQALSCSLHCCSRQHSEMVSSHSVVHKTEKAYNEVEVNGTVANEFS